MALPILSVPVVVRSLLASRGADVSNLRSNRIIALIDTALELMAYRVAHGPDYRGLQRRFPGLTPAGGVLDIAALGGDMIFDLARTQVWEGNTLLTPVDSLHVLRYGDLPTGQAYYAQDGTSLRFRASSGTLDTYSTEVVIVANFIPALDQVPNEYEGLFIHTLAELLTTQPEVRALEMSMEGRA